MGLESIARSASEWYVEEGGLATGFETENKQRECSRVRIARARRCVQSRTHLFSVWVFRFFAARSCALHFSLCRRSATSRWAAESAIFQFS